MQFEGEHLLFGQLGHFFIVLSVISSLLATVSFFLYARNKAVPDKGWLKIARISFFIQFISILFIFFIIYYICSHHYYEYMYAYKHASKELDPKYLLACIWEGQEGSFLLWAIWNGVLGSLLIFRAKEWEAPVMGIVSLAQWFLSLMILGIYFFDIRIGNSPFTLTRNEILAPIFSRPNYLSFVKDGMGLNVLLRNYWMVIHPPILFLGFASTIVPFAYAISGLLKKKFGEWIQPALPWALFSAGVLGTGIMMGGKWAYESLSFGGYWAWDPVENASMVPWLLLIAGLHTMVIYKATGHSLKAAFFFIMLTFSFVLYSTFLTRTGILGDTSVHAFTEAGKAINVMIGIMVLFFTVAPLFLLILNGKKIPTIIKEEETSSREFWMFMGALLLFLSALFISIITSIPVFNKTPLLNDLIIKIHGGPLALPEDPEFLYNKVMVMVAILLGLMTATAQYLKYKYTENNYFFKRIAIQTIAAALLATIILYVYPLTLQKHGIGFLAAIYIAFVCAIYSLIANAAYIWTGFKGKLNFAGGSVAHAGFALMLVGILISSSNKKVISDSSVNGINLGAGTDPMSKKQDDPKENLTLIRELPTTMSNYAVTYTGDSLGHEKGRKFYTLIFEDKKEKKSFVLKPDVYVMKDNNMSSNPDIRSFLDKDIFTYISYAINDKNDEDTTQFKVVEMKEGDTAFYSNGMFILNSVLKNPSEGRFHFTEKDAALVADISFISKDSMRYHAYPYIQVDSLGIYQSDDTVFAQNLFVKFSGVTEDRKIKVGIKESNKLIDFVTIKAFIFPYINLVWLGLIIMITGVFISMTNRARLKANYALIICILVITGLSYMFLIAGT